MQAGQDVILIARGKTLERLRTHGLTATQGTVTPAMHLDTVRATDDPTSVGPVFAAPGAAWSLDVGHT
jgi:hypothetical protein